MDTTVTSNPRLRVVEGRPWRESLICAITPEAPHQPWHEVSAVEPGDGVIVVIATDPATVLCGFIVGSGSLRHAIATKCRFGQSLPTVEELQQAAGGHRLVDGLPLDSPAATALLEAAGDYSVSGPEDRVGTSSVAAGRILLGSDGRCTCCNARVELAGATTDFSLHLVSEDDFREGRDWPALLCRSCTGAMAEGGYTSVIDYAFSLQPPCPACSARRSREVAYGMPTYTAHLNRPPWMSGGGCVVDSSGRWICDECGHWWGSRTNRFVHDPRYHDAARKLFAQWTGVTNPELLAALWNNLNTEDRGFWLERAADLERGGD